jgi:tRNA threonylcarbamoyladenosine biosynthesis protein TsaE
LEQSPHNQLVRISHSADGTRSIGAELAGHLSDGDLICLYGDLGAGKTTFIQGLASGLGVSDPVTSPSFTLVHEHRGRLLFYHLDLYRLAPGDLTEAGIEEVLSASAVVAVEWAERLPKPLRRGALEVHIAYDEDNPDSRRLRFRSLGERSARIVTALAEEADAPSRS